uniref:G2 and S-phase expressed 1 n=1 Tax=Latimeria chalumnae TaxID=7897 RepID=H3B082_LATCH
EITLLTDEKFDFDISLSPGSSKEDDEVFIGPVGHKEKCVAVNVEMTHEKAHEHQIVNLPNWIPLKGDQFVEIFKEAHLLALQLEKNGSTEQTKEKGQDKPRNGAVERFVEESKSKLKMFQKGKETPGAIKREIVCIQRSPLKQIPPVTQLPLVVPVILDPASLQETDTGAASPVKIKTPKKLSKSPQPQEKRSKSPLCKKSAPTINVNKIPSAKRQPVKAVHQPGGLFLSAEEPKLGQKVLPSRRKHLSSAGSSEEVCSDSPSVTSDVSDSSFNSSTLGPGKRKLPAPYKLGLKKPSTLKLPGAANRNATSVRRNTAASSSSSSISSLNSSFNSSMSVSPVGVNGGLSTSKNLQVASRNVKKTVPKLDSKLSNSSLAINPPSIPHKLTKSESAGKLLNAGNAARQTSASTVHAHSSTSKGIQRIGSISQLNQPSLQHKAGSTVKGNSCPKPKAPIVPTTPSQLKIPKRSGVPSPEPTPPKIMQPKRLLSCSAVGSGILAGTPLKQANGDLQNLGFSAKSVSVTPGARNISAFPTPLKRHTSGIPGLTPRTLPKPLCTPRQTANHQVTSMSAKRISVASPKQVECAKTKAEFSPSGTSSEQSPPLMVACTLSFTPEKIKLQASPQNEAIEHSSQSQQNNKGLLVDLEMNNGTPAREVEDKPLIDFSSSPEFHESIDLLKPPVVGQLINLSSPLICLSPIANKENEVDSPLLKF